MAQEQGGMSNAESIPHMTHTSPPSPSPVAADVANDFEAKDGIPLLSEATRNNRRAKRNARNVSRLVRQMRATYEKMRQLAAEIRRQFVGDGR